MTGCGPMGQLRNVARMSGAESGIEEKAGSKEEKEVPDLHNPPYGIFSLFHFYPDRFHPYTLAVFQSPFFLPDELEAFYEVDLEWNSDEAQEKLEDYLAGKEEEEVPGAISLPLLPYK